MCLRAIKIKDFVEQMTLDLFQNCDVPEEASVIFDPEIDLLLMMTPLVDSLRTSFIGTTVIGVSCSDLPVIVFSVTCYFLLVSCYLAFFLVPLY